MPDRANPALPLGFLEEHLRTTLEKANDWLIMKLANLPITKNCFVLPTARMPARCVACAWRQGMGRDPGQNGHRWTFRSIPSEHKDNKSDSGVSLGFDQFKMFHVVLWADIYICRRNAVVRVKIWSAQASHPLFGWMRVPWVSMQILTYRRYSEGNQTTRRPTRNLQSPRGNKICTWNNMKINTKHGKKEKRIKQSLFISYVWNHKINPFKRYYIIKFRIYIK